mmetsp:Transcript_33293/g.43909  ORF Transcript_33293/g.43909 Transcript_33293/m.43909 type:complete len:816 (-) Transcript_33293:274-2721(-)|eukprot:CAMPEP_0117739146 /NCGR_PEP_ID=MMETSP0947-20121206/3566_1 /TAXON_ID=44440 /ORGANISM="Chattonella subsalsa, Strain CCMP2191" /LENGTH=815 /DNA_ID=CAMNT_0005555001 /DNA_START=164 /DNA_END=2611 /DNA_ORIENTATION=+
MEIVKTDSFSSLYILEDEIGKGGSGVVYECRRMLDDYRCAVKVIDVRHLRLGNIDLEETIRREMSILSCLDHPNIVKTHDFFIEQEQAFVVMEFVKGKELFDIILEQPNRFFEEQKSKPIVKQILHAVQYLHSRKIIHRDIKPENIKVLNATSSNPTVKLIDFGVAKQLDDVITKAQTFVGTPCYLAPEIDHVRRVGGKYGPEVDIWSVGAVMHVMLVGRFPEFVEDLLNQKKEVRFRPELWMHVSQEAVDLIKGMMTDNPCDRFTVADALHHKWFSSDALNGQALEQNQITPPSSNAQIVKQDTRIVKQAHIAQTSEQHQIMETSEKQQVTQISVNCPQTGSQLGQIQVAESTSKTTKRVLSPVDGTGGIDEVNINVKRRVVCTGSVPETAASNEIMPLSDPALALLQGSSTTSPTFTTSLQKVTPDDAKLDVNNIAQATGIGPMVQLQRSIANLFRNILPVYIDNPRLASSLRQGALLCREQVRENDKLLNKIQRVSGAILQLFGDLDLAVEESEPELAKGFFVSLRKWVSDLSGNIKEAQTSQSESTQKVHNLMEQAVCLGKSKVESIETKIDEEMKSVVPTESIVPVNKETLEVVKDLKKLTQETSKKGADELNDHELLDILLPNIHKITDAIHDGDTEGSKKETAKNYAVQANIFKEWNDDQLVDVSDDLAKLEQDCDDIRALVSKLLGDLYKIDQVMDHLASLWSNIEVVLDILLVKAEHVERFVKYAQKPKLFLRFRQRLGEYYKFWEGIQIVCGHFLGSSSNGSTMPNNNSGSAANIYGFLGQSQSIEDTQQTKSLTSSTFVPAVEP